MCLDFQRYQKLAEAFPSVETVTISNISPPNGVAKLVTLESNLGLCKKIFEESAYKGGHHLIDSMQHLLTNPKQPLINWKRPNHGFYRGSWMFSNGINHILTSVDLVSLGPPYTSCLLLNRYFVGGAA